MVYRLMHVVILCVVYSLRLVKTGGPLYPAFATPTPCGKIMSKDGSYSVYLHNWDFLFIFIGMVHPIVLLMRVMPMAPFHTLIIFWVLYFVALCFSLSDDSSLCLITIPSLLL